MSSPPPPRYCSAPWTQGVFQINGALRPCCRSAVGFGKITDLTPIGAWHSVTAQEFRSKITKGDFPHETCRICYENGTSAKLSYDVGRSVRKCFDALYRFLHEIRPEYLVERDRAQLNIILENNHITPAQETFLLGFYNKLLNLADSELTKLESFPTQYLRKLISNLEVLLDYFSGSLTPRRLSPFRQISLITHCNALCIHCTVLQWDKVASKTPAVGWNNRQAMSEDLLNMALTDREAITDFFLNGTELLMYKNWRKIAEVLFQEKVAFSLSTNGILLDRSTIDFLLSKPYLGNLNISVDGGTPETIERIRVNVSFARLNAQIPYLFQKLKEYEHSITIQFSYVLMKSNFKELPQLIELIVRWRGDQESRRVSILIQSLDYAPGKEYRELVDTEHVTRIDRFELYAVLHEVNRLAQENNIEVTIFYSYLLHEFLENRVPLPGIPF